MTDGRSRAPRAPPSRQPRLPRACGGDEKPRALSRGGRPETPAPKIAVTKTETPLHKFNSRSDTDKEKKSELEVARKSNQTKGGAWGGGDRKHKETENVVEKSDVHLNAAGGGDGMGQSYICFKRKG